MPEPRIGEPGKRGGDNRPLSAREREILGLLAAGESGAQIAKILVLSPETVRTHIRNAMVKLGASSRAQAVALAVYRQEIGAPPTLTLQSEGSLRGEVAPPATGAARARAAVAAGEFDARLSAVLSGLVSLYDVEAGALFLSDDDGLSLRRAAVLNEGDDSGLGNPPASVLLGEGPLGRAALERRAQLIHGSGARGGDLGQATIFAPMIASGRLLGVICLATRPSRLIGRSELLLLQAFGNRIAEILVASGHPGDKLEQALGRFRASWAGTNSYA